MDFGRIMALAGWAWDGRPPSGAWAWGYGGCSNPEGQCVPSPGIHGLSGGMSLCSCPQLRFWLQWLCTVGASLGAGQGPAHSRVEAATPACRLTEKVRSEVLA